MLAGRGLGANGEQRGRRIRQRGNGAATPLRKMGGDHAQDVAGAAKPCRSSSCRPTDAAQTCRARAAGRGGIDRRISRPWSSPRRDQPARRQRARAASPRRARPAALRPRHRRPRRLSAGIRGRHLHARAGRTPRPPAPGVLRFDRTRLRPRSRPRTTSLAVRPARSAQRRAGSRDESFACRPRAARRRRSVRRLSPHQLRRLQAVQHGRQREHGRAALRDARKRCRTRRRNRRAGVAAPRPIEHDAERARRAGRTVAHAVLHQSRRAPGGGRSQGSRGDRVPARHRERQRRHPARPQSVAPGKHLSGRVRHGARCRTGGPAPAAPCRC